MKINYIFLFVILIFFMSGCSTTRENKTTDGISANVSEELEEEILPFYITPEMSIYEYDEDNILGLKVIYVKDDTIIYRFSSQIDFAAYSKMDGFYANVKYNSDEDVSEEQFSIFSYRGDQYVIIQCKNAKAIEGFWISRMRENCDSYSLTMQNGLRLKIWQTKTLRDGKMERHTIIQEYEQAENTWGEVVEEDLSYYTNVLVD